MATVAGRHMNLVEIYDDYYRDYMWVFVPANIELISEYSEAIAELEEERMNKKPEGSGAW